MNRFFNYYTSLCSGSNTHNVFSYDPYIIAIKKMLLCELQKIVYYIEKLKDLNVDMSEYTDKVIDFISVIIINLDFKKESFFIIMKDLFANRKKLEKMYIDSCKNANIEYILLEGSDENFSSNEDILKVLNEQEKNIKQNKIKYSKNKKCLFEIIISLVLNACNCLIELKNFQVDFPQAKNMVLKLLNSSNTPSLDDKELISIIKDFSACNYQIMKLLSEKNIERYGAVTKSNVPLTQREGKAILVSDSSYCDLEKILIAAQKYDIDVYTHHNMINAFMYEKLKSYPNLYGSFKRSDNNLFIDFAAFPGPIFVSRNALLKTDVIRGQIYTCAKYPAYGIGKIENDDFSPIIEYALQSKGFDKTVIPVYKSIGYIEEDIQNMLSEIIFKYNNQEIKHIHIIGLFDSFNTNDNYIKDFLKSVPADDYIISFSYNTIRENFFFINCSYDFYILYKIIETLFKQIPNIKPKLGVFMVDCNSLVLSDIFNLIYLDVKNIFLGPCCPNVISPDLIKSLSKLFYISPITRPLEDIDKYK